MALFSETDHAGAATSGRYCGRTASAYVKEVSHGTIDEAQVESEKARVYAPVKRSLDLGHHVYDWKDVNHGLARIMQDYCSEWKNEEGLKEGLQCIRELRESETTKMFARTPHELMRVMEVFALMTCGEVIMEASLARKASHMGLQFFRTDYPEMQPPEWEKLLTIKLSEDGSIAHGELPLQYWLKPPYASTYAENYKAHRAKK